MKAVIQRVGEARVEVEGRVVGSIGRGLLVLLAVEKGDGPEEAGWLAEKIVHLRVFGDEAGNLNRSLLEVGGEALVVSQFTLAGTTRRGRRPSFDRAASGPQAEDLYELFAGQARRLGVRVETGVFGAMMKVHLVNEGPVTFIVETPAKGGAPGGAGCPGAAADGVEEEGGGKARPCR